VAKHQENVGMINKAKRLALEGNVGWLCPDGRFIEVPETGGEIAGLTLGRHEAGAIALLEANYRHLLPELIRRRTERGCTTWPETTRFNLIKGFMAEHGFFRVAEDILSMSDFK